MNVALLIPASSPGFTSSSSTSNPSRSAHRRYIRSSISAQSWDSVPPAPACNEATASLASYSPPRSAASSSAATSASSCSSDASSSLSVAGPGGGALEVLGPAAAGIDVKGTPSRWPPGTSGRRSASGAPSSLRRVRAVALLVLLAGAARARGVAGDLVRGRAGAGARDGLLAAPTGYQPLRSGAGRVGLPGPAHPELLFPPLEGRDGFLEHAVADLVGVLDRLELLDGQLGWIRGLERGHQPLQVPLLGEDLGADVLGNGTFDHFGDHLDGLVAEVLALEDPAPVTVDDPPLGVHDLVVLEDVLS